MTTTTIDPNTGILSALNLTAGSGVYTVTCTNSEGFAAGSFTMVIGAAPVVSGTVPTPIYATGDGPVTIDAADFIVGATSYALRDDGGKATIDATTGLLEIDTYAEFDLTMTITATNADGSLDVPITIKVEKGPQFVGSQEVSDLLFPGPGEPAVDLSGYIDTPGGEDLIWALTPVPAGMTFDTATGILNPSAIVAGSNGTVTLSVQDGISDRTGSVTFNITAVVTPKVAPTLTGTLIYASDTVAPTPPPVVPGPGPTPTPPPPAGSGAVYVDYDTGSNTTGDGTSTKPYKTVPDSLAPGTTAYFKRGSTYREHLFITSAGQANAPVVLDFETWGAKADPAALVDLSVEIPGFTGPTQANGKNVWTAPYPAGLDINSWTQTLLVQEGTTLMCPAQLPVPADRSRVNDVNEWYDHSKSGFRWVGADHQAGYPAYREFITAPDIALQVPGNKVGLKLRIWQWGNLTDTFEIVADNGGDEYEVAPYQQSRPILFSNSVTILAKHKYAIINDEACLSPGTYLVDDAAQTISVHPSGAQTPSTERYARAGEAPTTRGAAIEVAAPYVEVRGAGVRMASSSGSSSAGVLLMPRNSYGGTAGAKAVRCEVDACMVAGAGIYAACLDTSQLLQSPQVEDCKVTAMLGVSCRGIMFSGVRGGMIRGCFADKTTSTGISCYNTHDARIYGNTSGRSAGVHGNGFSFYEGCRRLKIACNVLFQPELEGIALTLQSAGECTIVFNTFLTGSDLGAVMNLYGPKSRYPELGNHRVSNNVIMAMNDGKAFKPTMIEIWGDVPNKKVDPGDRRRDPDDPQNRAWECLVLNYGPTSTGQTFAQYRAANPTHWQLYGGTGLFADWPVGPGRLQDLPDEQHHRRAG